MPSVPESHQSTVVPVDQFPSLEEDRFMGDLFWGLTIMRGGVLVFIERMLVRECM